MTGVEATAADSTVADGPGPRDGTPTDRSRQVRGSSLLLAGRFISMGTGFVLQVAIVRYLTKTDYGSFEYALSIISLGASLTALGLDKALSRFLPMYEEQGERGKVLGALVLSVLAMGIVAVVVAGGLLLLRDLLASVMSSTSILLLTIMLPLIPALAAEALATAVFSVLASPRAIFFRRHVLAPALELAVVAFVVLGGAGVVALAAGWVVAGLLGIGIYLVTLLSVLRRRRILTRQGLGAMRLPAREVLTYSLPLLSTDLVFVLRGSLVVILLGILATTVEVAAFRAVYPQARLILIVLNSFTYLFIPAAARLVARGAFGELSGLQWHSTAWITLLSFPAFAVSFVLADGVTVLLYGEAYATSAPILMILSFGFMVSSALAPAGLSLRALGRVRYLVSVDLTTALAGVIAYLVLIPPLGAVGAAIGTAGTLIAQGLAYQAGAFRNGLQPPDRATVLMGMSLVATTVGLAALEWIVRPPLWAGMVVVGVVCLAVLRANRGLLDLGGTFPELGRVPGLRWVMGISPRP